MSFNFVPNSSSINNKQINTNNKINQPGATSSQATSIFNTSLSSVSRTSESIFSASAASASNMDSVSLRAGAQNISQTSSEQETDGGLWNSVVNFFSQNQQKNSETSSVANALAVLQKAQSVTSSAQAQALLKKAEKSDGEENEQNDSKTNNKSIQLTEDNNNEKTNENKEVDYSKSSRLELANAFAQGKPSNPTQAIQMLNNGSLSHEQIQKIKDKFPDDSQVNDLIGNLQANVS